MKGQQWTAVVWLGTGLLQYFSPLHFPIHFLNTPFFGSDNFAASSQHPKPFGISDGLEKSLSQLFLGGVLREQQCIKAGVGGW